MKNQLKLKRGFGLTELMIGLGLVTVLSFAGYLIYGVNASTATAHAEQSRINEVSQAIERSYGTTGGYKEINISRVLQDNLVDKKLLVDGKLETKWGQAITVNPQQIYKENDGFSVHYSQTPSDICIKLVPSMSSRVYQTRINGELVQNGDESTFNLNKAITACDAKQKADIDFIFYMASASGLVAADPIELPENTVPPATPSEPSLPIEGHVPIDDGGDATAPQPVNPDPIPSLPIPPIPEIKDPDPVSPVTPPAITPPVVTPPVINPPAVCVPSQSNEERICPLGQYGYQEWSVRRVCGSWEAPEAWATPVIETVMTRNNCQACPSNRVEESFQLVTRTEACSGGRTGTVTYQMRQKGSRSISYACPLGQRQEPAPSFGEWNWQDTGEIVSRDESGCSSPGLVVTGSRAQLTVSNQSPTIITTPVTLAENTSWTYLIGQSGEWPSTYGPVRGSASATISYNGSVQTISVSGGASNTARPGSPADFSQGPWTYNFNGKVVEFEFRGTARADNSSIIRGSVALYYRVK